MFHSCDFCGDRIGVWEAAAFVVDEDEPHATTQAATPDLAADATKRYHRDCYPLLQQQPTAA